MSTASLLGWVRVGFQSGHRERGASSANGSAMAARRRRLPRLEPLEERIALSTIAVNGVHDKPLHTTPATVELLKNAVATISPPDAMRSAASLRHRRSHTLVNASSVTVGSNGDVTVALADGSSQVYQKVAAGWKLINWNHQTAAGWTQESWGPDRSYTQDVWSSKQHGAVGAAGSISQTVVADRKMTFTLFHKTGNHLAFGYNFFASPQWWAVNCEDAKISWVYDVTPEGTRGAPLDYHLVNGGYWYNAGAWWQLHPPSGWYTDGSHKVAGGWFQGYPGGHNSQSKFLPPSRFPASVSLNTSGATVAVPAGLTVESATANGNLTETFKTTAYPNGVSFVAFVYEGQNKKDLSERIQGGQQGGKWKTTATAANSKAFITQDETYDKLGGNLLSSVTVRKAPDGQHVTFTGTWKSGTAIGNATGKATAANYLGFSSVTVDYQNGKPVTRDGPLQGGGYAVDAFNASGTAVTKREISNTKGGPVVQTWTGSERDLTISQVSPSSAIKQETFKYKWDAPHASTAFTLLNYDATFVKPVALNFFDRTKPVTETSTTYAWRAFASYIKAGDYWDWNYREQGQAGGEHNADSSPNPQVPPHGAEPKLDDYWNKV